MWASELSEVRSLGAVLPFIAILVDPYTVFNHPYVQPINDLFKINSPEELVFPLTLIFIFTALAAGCMRIIVLWISSRFAGAIGTDLSFEVYNRTLYQPYKVHLARNSSVIISGITGKVNNVVSMVLLPIMALLSSALLLIGVVSTLIVVAPLIASVS